MSDYRLLRYTPEEKHDLYTKVLAFWESVCIAYPHRRNEDMDKITSAQRMLKGLNQNECYSLA